MMEQMPWYRKFFLGEWVSYCDFQAKKYGKSNWIFSPNLRCKENEQSFTTWDALFCPQDKLVENNPAR